MRKTVVTDLKTGDVILDGLNGEKVVVEVTVHSGNTRMIVFDDGTKKMAVKTQILEVLNR